MIFISSDNHFNHKKIIEYGRPKDYEWRILDGFKILTNEDLFINLGDFCIGKDAEVHERVLSKIPCTRVLVLGNHDNKSYAWYYKNGWDFVCSSFSIKYGGKKILFSHIPIVKSDLYDINIHGHLHTPERNDRLNEFNDIGGEYLPEYHKLISLENNGYKLTRIEDIIK